MTLEDSRLRLRTRSFRAGMESVLHSGIFTPELTSSLASGAVVVIIVGASLLGGLEFAVAHVAGIIALFVVLFLVLRKYVFYEQYLEAVMDKASDRVSLRIKKFMGEERSHRLSDLKEVRRGRVVVEPENPDGVDFVAKIAIQHGQALPGFGETKTYYTVNLLFNDGTEETLFSSENEEDSEVVTRRIGDFVGGGVAQEE
ncbi:MAG: hypothetical protein PVG55_00370 [Nitrospirota bacterium]